MSKRFITSEEVAVLLDLPDGPAFLRRREELEDEHRFPPPMPHSRRPLLWRDDQVKAWIETQGVPAATGFAAAMTGSNVVLLEEARK